MVTGSNHPILGNRYPICAAASQHRVPGCPRIGSRAPTRSPDLSGFRATPPSSRLPPRSVETASSVASAQQLIEDCGQRAGQSGPCAPTMQNAGCVLKRKSARKLEQCVAKLETNRIGCVTLCKYAQNFGRISGGGRNQSVCAGYAQPIQ